MHTQCFKWRFNRVEIRQGLCGHNTYFFFLFSIIIYPNCRSVCYYISMGKISLKKEKEREREKGGGGGGGERERGG